MASGLATILAMAVLPLFETLFNVPTRFKLIELADSSNRLLQDLFPPGPVYMDAYVDGGCSGRKSLRKTGIEYDAGAYRCLLP